MSNVEKGSAYYDAVYRRGGANQMYFRKPEETPYITIWKKIITMLDENSVIADFGCGVGQFAQLVINHGLNYSYGVDFSLTAIEMAKKRTGRDCFYLADLYDPSSFKLKEYNTAIFLETLEHIRDDQKVLSYLPEGVRVIFSVPNYYDCSHVRTYNRELIEKQYGDLLNLIEIIPFKVGQNAVIYLCDAVKAAN